ncbi:hypothetical protein I6A84_14625 [Frankia sp. CNm7]|uniref:Uncharacterized protein n=1 Tax=Frankia nepalensis TaxID=1836974 RepID=A0A937RK31_9ACTN|nr:hypothetical protein [Frankia nepalensis]MBL7502711.1 hypothetical protein [Frankia nepalensis]MBL7512976.1 hypothetical protein [Frankia nepalensis]MBL7519304.1 hypothetical protein [Frankia nepalensis]MBL7628779.1 hypothetical protein [Frankia nepalensis]
MTCLPRGSQHVLLPCVVMFGLALAVVVGRLLAIGDSDITRFAVVGSTYVDTQKPPPGLHVFPGDGYDGQFAYRLGLAPYDLRTHARGIVIDSPLRAQRIGYPTIAWLLAAGQARWVPVALVAANVLALAALGLLGGMVARDAGRHPLWGVLLAGFPGFLFSLGRDLTEIVAAAFAVAGFLAWRRKRPVLAGACLTVAVLSRETALLAAVGIAAAHLAEVRTRRTASRAADASAWLLPVIGFGLWQAVVAAETGALPVRTGSGDNMTVPLAGLLPSMLGWLRDATSPPGQAPALLALGQFVVLCALAGLAAARLRRLGGATEVKVGGALALLLAVCLSSFVLRTPAFFRQLADVHVFAAIALLDAPGRLRLPGAALAVVWACSAVLIAISI